MEGLVPPQDNEKVPPSAPQNESKLRVTRVLIDPDDPFYIWEPDKKPVPRTPCLLVQEKAHVRVLDMKGNLLGRGVAPP